MLPYHRARRSLNSGQHTKPIYGPRRMTATNPKVSAIRNLRWWIGGMLFASTVINYLDRQTLSNLAPYLKEEYGWTNTDYANLIIANPRIPQTWSHWPRRTAPPRTTGRDRRLSTPSMTRRTRFLKSSLSPSLTSGNPLYTAPYPPVYVRRSELRQFLAF